MALTLSIVARTVVGQALTQALDEGTQNPNAFIEIRTGVRPTTADAQAPGNVLAVINLANPSFGTFVGGKAYANETLESDGIDASGRATWFRLYSKAGITMLDGDISATDGRGDLRFSISDFRMGGTIDLSTLAIEFT